MKKEIENLEFVILDETGIIDFKDYVIPSLYDQLTSLESFEDEMILMAGAVVDGVPIAAIAAQLFETDEVYIHSIVVDEEYRNLGIGTELLRAILQLSDKYLDPNPGEDLPYKVFVHTEYALAGEMLKNYEGFLRKNGFNDFYDYPPLYIFDAQRISKLGKPSPHAIPFTEMEGAGEEELEEFFQEQGLYPELDLCFYNGSKDDPKCFLMVQNLEDGVFTVTSACENENAVSEDLEELFLSAVSGISKRASDFRIVVDCEKNMFPEFWAKYDDFCEIKSTHREAGLYIIVE